MINMDIANQRLMNQGIQNPAYTTAADVVRWMGALQAQDYGQAVWAIGSRMQTARLDDVEQAIADRSIVRTWPMRGTIHFIPAEDTRWMLKLSASRMLAADKRRLEHLELTMGDLEHCKELLYQMLQGGVCLARPEIMQLFTKAGIHTTGQRGYHILWYLAQSGHICMGPLQGKQQTFALLDEWAPGQRNLSHDESLAELANRYFKSHGPATVYDFAWWAGITVRDAKVGLAAVQSRLICEKVDSTELWLTPGVTPANQHMSGVYMLPGFDEYLLGYKDRSAVLDPAHASKIVPGNNGIFLPVIVADGRVVGIWKRTVRPKRVAVAIQLFTAQPHLKSSIETQAQRYASFMGLPLELAYI